MFIVVSCFLCLCLCLCVLVFLAWVRGVSFVQPVFEQGQNASSLVHMSHAHVHTVCFFILAQKLSRQLDQGRVTRKNDCPPLAQRGTCLNSQTLFFWIRALFRSNIDVISTKRYDLLYMFFFGGPSSHGHIPEARKLDLH